MDATGTAYPAGHASHVPGTLSVAIPTTIPASLHAAYLAGDAQARADLSAGFPAIPVNQDSINREMIAALRELKEEKVAERHERAEESDKKKGRKVGATLNPRATLEESRAALGTDFAVDNIPGHLYERLFPRSQHVTLLYWREDYLKAYGDPNSAASKEITKDLSLPLPAMRHDDFDPERLDIWINAEHAYSQAMVKARYFKADEEEKRSDITLSLGLLKDIVIKLHSRATFATQRKAAMMYYSEILGRTLGGQNGGVVDVTTLDQDVYQFCKDQAEGHHLAQLADFAQRYNSAPRLERTASAPGLSGPDRSSGRDARDSRDARSYRDSRDNQDSRDRDSNRYSPMDPTQQPFSARGNDRNSNTTSPRKQSTSVCFFCGSTAHGAKECNGTGKRNCKHDPTNNKFYIAPKSPFALAVSTAKDPAERRSALSTSAAPSASVADVVPQSTPTKELNTDEEIALFWVKKITTPLISRAWAKLLSVIHPKAAKPYAHFPASIDGGFDLGIPPSVLIETTRAPKPTRPQTAEEHQGTQRHIVEEQEVERFSPELRKAAVEKALGPFQTSPMIPVPKEVTPEKNPWRIVRHFSSPENGSYPSVNDLLREYPVALPTYWTPIAEFGNIVLNASCEAEALVVDVKDAFRIIPIKPEQRRWTVIQWGLLYIIDVGLVMGLVPATDIWGSLVDLMRMYFAVVFAAIIVRNWVDDIVHIAEPTTGTTFAILEASLLAVYVWLGVPLSPHKTLSFSPIFPFCGYIWNLQTKYVYLKPSKRKKYLDALTEALTGTVSISQEDMEKIGGFLSHLCYLVPRGKSYMVEIYRFQGSMSPFKPKTEHHPPDRCISELRWWLDILRQEGDIGRFLIGYLPTADVTIISDACPRGVGILVGKKWDYLPCIPGWDATSDDNIDRAEAIGVLLALILLFGIYGTSLDGHVIKALCDNKSVVGGWAKGRNRNAAVNLIIREIDQLLCIHGCRLSLKYVKSEENEADPVSRGDFGDIENRSDRLDLDGNTLVWPESLKTCVDFISRTPA